jgi:hypothetical protein
VHPFVYDVALKPSLIPQPQQISWHKGLFPLHACKTIVVKDKVMQKEAGRLQVLLNEKGLPLQIRNEPVSGEPFIELVAQKAHASYANEAYRLTVTGERVMIGAQTAKGIFYGVQTLLQLARNNSFIEACTITDWPAFSWRGYMVDVGRNYQSMKLLKQQVDAMARYKLNIFHFHFTEDIAWRLAFKQYPQLTDPENMLRDKGLYYTEEDLKELIQYCKERHITLVPEIDMPGHSAAFTRAFGFEMQSDSGTALIKKILTNFIETYDVPYVHIGADEVKIWNKAFVPEITRFIQQKGKKVIGWEPGGNFISNTIRQLWMDDNGKVANGPSIQYIDSRHLYINHMDPLESVVTLFFRKIGDREKGDDNALGGTLCLWHDRAVANEDDLLRMNPVYPALITFAERIWKGGGEEKWTAAIGAPGSPGAQAFAAYEKKLLDHKQQYFKDEPFPYAPQSNSVWRLFGPYKNNGNVKAVFKPEEEGFVKSSTEGSLEAVGGTLVLRHWWAPMINGVLAKPEDSTTWYAQSKIWSAVDGYKSFWIGFNNLSRSPATNPPPVGAWNKNMGQVWVNGKIIQPPTWHMGGQRGHSEIPLQDEGYEYREPSKIYLKKGWNEVLIKIPVGSFKGSDWQNPVKWMFTFVPVKEPY